ncbi:MAG: V-type ATP synthase subunit D [Desulfobacterales bacterium]|nr:V-type ATP synthase subunit D [Desulfobacterales bacterium]MBF0395278.1 V-type ATP synthase subunit D [Desulfobacterales bacterium]
MSGKIKKTRPELLKQRRQLSSFERYLPTLILKKQQIQMEILKVRSDRSKISKEIENRINSISDWISLFGESIPGKITRLVQVKNVLVSQRNVAGIALPVLNNIEFDVKEYSFFATPPWVDIGINFIKDILRLRETIRILTEQESLLQKEIRKVTQRVNLFEKVMIPKTKENIRVIRIQLAEEETSAVGRAKIAKSKGGKQ